MSGLTVVTSATCVMSGLTVVTSATCAMSGLTVVTSALCSESGLTVVTSAPCSASSNYNATAAPASLNRFSVMQSYGNIFGGMSSWTVLTRHTGMKTKYKCSSDSYYEDFDSQ